MVREHEGFGLMTAPMIQQHTRPGSLIMVCQLIQTDLQVDRVQERPFRKEALPRRGFDGPLQREILDRVLHRPRRFNATHRDASPLDGEEPHTTFILAKEAHRPLCGWLRHGLERSDFLLEHG
jgi:hypothetical protein